MPFSSGELLKGTLDEVKAFGFIGSFGKPLVKPVAAVAASRLGDEHDDDELDEESDEESTLVSFLVVDEGSESSFSMLNTEEPFGLSSDEAVSL